MNFEITLECDITLIGKAFDIEVNTYNGTLESEFVINRIINSGCKTTPLAIRELENEVTNNLNAVIQFDNEENPKTFITINNSYPVKWRRTYYKIKSFREF